MKETSFAICRGSCGVMGVMLLASVALGFAYNRASPLGLRGWEASSKAASAAPTIKRTGYFNETLSLTLEGTTSSPAGAGAINNPANATAIPGLTWPEVKALLAKNQAVLVDARATQYFQAGAIPGAVSLPGPTFNSAIAAFASQYVQNTPLVIYCSSPQCPLSHNVAEALITRFGYTNVKLMPGGYQEYTLAENAQGGAAK